MHASSISQLFISASFLALLRSFSVFLKLPLVKFSIKFTSSKFSTPKSLHTPIRSLFIFCLSALRYVNPSKNHLEPTRLLSCAYSRFVLFAPARLFSNFLVPTRITGLPLNHKAFEQLPVPYKASAPTRL